MRAEVEATGPSWGRRTTRENSSEHSQNNGTKRS
ncbi:Uncharacterised protein [Mycobacteroides abscessus]|nr:Uncharacterised protein [Mycobacteroides abscessus]